MSRLSGQQPPQAAHGVPPGLTLGTEPSHERGALSALFARASRNSERIILPINDSAFERGSSRPAFYCIHSLSGAGGMDFCHLAKLLPNLPFYGIQAPPKKMADAEFGRSVESIADYYADALVKHQPDGPFLLGGWSAGAMIGLSAILGRRVKDSVKSSPYESGMKPVGNARERYSVKFYLVAMVFILFDIEAIFLYPWAVVFRELKLFAFFEMLLFIALVLCGFFYIWKKGVLDWSQDEQREEKRENRRAA